MQLAPLDEELGLKAYQQTSIELMQMGCLLTVFVPFETACVLLEKLTGIQLSATALWNWVQSAGKKAIEDLEQELALLESGTEPTPEKLAPTIHFPAFNYWCRRCHGSVSSRDENP